MKEFSGKVAVVTGAASGIGRAIAKRCALEGMKVVLADIEEKALTETEDEMKAAGAGVLAVLTDVSKSGDIKMLAQETLGAFGSVHLLFNNAGVGGSFPNIWESTLSDWEWVLGVNLWGVIHGICTFIPIMLEQGNECHVVNTASITGLLSSPGMGIYMVSKHGIVTISETLYHELAMKKAKIKVSVLCPGAVDTRILDSERNRPDFHAKPLQSAPVSGDNALPQSWFRKTQKEMPPQQVADHVFRAIRDEKFYILTHPEFKPAIQLRMEDILQERNPTDSFAGTSLE